MENSQIFCLEKPEFRDFGKPMLLGSEKVKEESEREALNFVIMTNSLLL
jgi:hypothetical protein